MLVQKITHLVAFNRWADERFFDALSLLSDEHYSRDLHSSHGGIHGTLAHIVGVEKAWLRRWLSQPEGATSPLSHMRSLAELRVYWQGVCAEISQFVGTLDERKLQETLETTTLAGPFTAPYWQMIQHVVDHSSYHRGQIVSMLRQLGVTPPSTGMMRFYRDTSTAG